jgi:hypothetical protein
MKCTEDRHVWCHHDAWCTCGVYTRDDANNPDLSRITFDFVDERKVPRRGLDPAHLPRELLEVKVDYAHGLDVPEDLVIDANEDAPTIPVIVTDPPEVSPQLIAHFKREEELRREDLRMAEELRDMLTKLEVPDGRRALLWDIVGRLER